MKKLFTLIFLPIICLMALNCKNLSEENQVPETLLDSKCDCEDLPGYRWLHNYENFGTQKHRDSLLYYYNHTLENKKYDDVVWYLSAYGEASAGTFEFDTFYFDLIHNFYNDYKDKIGAEGITNLCYYIGNQYHTANNLAKSSEFLKKAIEVTPVSKSHRQIQGFSNFALAQNYTLLRDFTAAEKHLIDALSIFKEVGDITNQGTVYLLLHNIYMQKGVYGEAENMLSKALKIVKQQKSDFLTFSAYNLYVHLNVAKADTLSAIKYIDTLSIYSKTYNHIPKYQETILNQLLAFKHIAQREEEEALEFLKTSRNLSDASNSPDLQMRTLFQELMYTEIFDRPLKNPVEVEEFYNQLASEDDPNNQFMVQLGTALRNYHAAQGDYEKAFTYAQLLLKDKNKALDELITGRLFELEKKFETEQKENKILLQEKKLESQNKMILGLVASAVFLILLFSLLIIWNKNRSILREKALTESFTSQLLNKTEDERKRIASDLHDSVSNELVNLRHALEENSLSFKSKIDGILEEVRNISRNLSPTLFDKLGLKDSIEQLTERAQNQKSFLLTSDIEYSGSLSKEVELQLYRIIQEATTNIIKHSDALAGKITLTEDSKFVYAEIKDNGKGFDVAKMMEKGNCFGLLNITERTKFINGTVQFNSNAKGTVIKIAIPK